MDITVDQLHDALRALTVIDIRLDTNDDAQLIFESLNYTGLDLSEADKIRNFVLMNLDQHVQEKYYDEYWNVIEKNTHYKVSEYIRFYLAAHKGAFPNIQKVYSEFRAYVMKDISVMQQDEITSRIEEILQDMRKYSVYYQNCIEWNTGKMR